MTGVFPVIDAAGYDRAIYNMTGILTSHDRAFPGTNNQENNLDRTTKRTGDTSCRLPGGSPSGSTFLLISNGSEANEAREPKDER